MYFFWAALICALLLFAFTPILIWIARYNQAKRTILEALKREPLSGPELRLKTNGKLDKQVELFALTRRLIEEGLVEEQLPQTKGGFRKFALTENGRAKLR